MQPAPADTIIDARWIVPVEPAGVVLEAHSLVIGAGEILAVLPTSEVAARYAPTTHLQLDEHVLIPGLVNLHTHAAMSLMRGLADDRPLMDWLHNHIWPVETQIVSHAFVRDGTLLACAEMLRSGITCFSDMYFFPEAAAEAALEAGMRAAIGMIVIEMRSPYASDAQDYLAKGLAMRDALRDEHLLSFCLAPHAPYTTSDETLQRVVTYGNELDVPIHIHLHETTDEIRESLDAHKVRPIERLQRLGMLGPNLIAVHAVHLEPAEIDLLAHYGCSVAHCPTSNLKLASGIAPVARMLECGLNVGLGTDGAASNNRQDLMSDMRLAALLAKGSSGSATAVPAHTALHMATLAGAKALAIDARVGSLKPGKRADVTAVRLADLELSPLYDPVSHLVYAAGREHVTHVWVDGVPRVADGALTALDAREIKLKASHWAEKIKAQESGSRI
jgi:5-methylthioadenosine/S-adenosylhomocysteine deaminase